jgi:hypothetical protein
MKPPARALGAALSLAVVASCGLPSGGGHSVDDDEVPYRLLEERPDDGADPPSGTPAPLERVVFWTDEQDRLVPRTSSESGCPVDVQALLDELSAGPPQGVRDTGLGTALPPDSRLQLVAVQDDLAVIDLDTETQVSAERLPIAVGQLVLTLAAAPRIERVSFLDDGEPVQVPDADGVLTATPVGASAYEPLVPAPYRRSPVFRGGTAADDSCAPVG